MATKMLTYSWLSHDWSEFLENTATHSSSPSKDLGKEWWITNRTCATAATVTRLRIRTRPLVRIYHHMTCAIKLTLLKLTNMEIHVQRRSVGTSRLFTPIPKAMVATMMGVSPALSFNVCDQMMRREIPSCLGMRLPPSLPYEISSSGSLALKIIWFLHV